MPNWCHNTLTVSGEAEELQRFIEAARPHEADIRAMWDSWGDGYLERDKPKPEWEGFLREQLDGQPLSFESLCPQPSDEELRQLERYQPCTMCGAHGTLPDSEEQAAEREAKWYPWMDPAERENRTCNACGGTKEERVGMQGWYEWRLCHWGTKWDASFGGGPMIAMGAEGMDVDATTSAQGATITPTVVVYKFDTAWSPPVPVIEVASEKFPELEFVIQFAEIGNEYAGRERFVSGVMVESEELEVEDVLAPEEMWF